MWRGGFTGWKCPGQQMHHTITMQLKLRIMAAPANEVDANVAIESYRLALVSPSSRKGEIQVDFLFWGRNLEGQQVVISACEALDLETNGQERQERQVHAVLSFSPPSTRQLDYDSGPFTQYQRPAYLALCSSHFCL